MLTAKGDSTAKVRESAEVGRTILYEATISSNAQAAMHLWKELEHSRDVKLVR